jgi:hypothetical protein
VYGSKAVANKNGVNVDLNMGKEKHFFCSIMLQRCRYVNNHANIFFSKKGSVLSDFLDFREKKMDLEKILSFWDSIKAGCIAFYSY